MGAADSRLFAPSPFDLFESSPSSSHHSGRETPSYANLRVSTKMHKDKAILSLYGFIFMHFSGLQGGYNQLEASRGGWRSGAMHQWIPEKGSPPSPGHLPDQEVAQGSNMAKGEK